MTRPSSSTPLRIAAEVGALAAVYVATARAGLGMDAVSGFATLVWAPTGLALAALFLRGNRLWPGVAIGALIANLLTGAPVGVALGIAAGNTLEAVAGAWLLRRVGFQPAIDRLRDAIALIALAALASTALSATIGVASLSAGGLVAGDAVADTWRAWWVGDMIGALFVAPALLIWLTTPIGRPSVRRIGEATAMGFASLAAAWLVFGAARSGQPNAFTQAYLFFPVLIWAALRFGPRGAVSSSLLVATIAIWGTTMGHGPFARPALHESLFALQAFMSVVGATFLVLGAVTGDRVRATRELEAAVDQAQQARDQAASANRSKGEFLGVVSHELRTPLNAIFGFTELLTLGINGPLNSKQLETVDRIRRNQTHLLGLVEDVLRFARIEAGTLTYDVRVVRLRDTITEVEAAIDPQARKKSIALSLPSVDGMHVRADADKLRQVLINVAGNAVKFTPDGGEIAIHVEDQGPMVAVSVRDNGIGIPSEHLARVFEPFYQVELGKTRQHGGVGLGLAIARDLARGMQCDVAMTSQFGRGTTVTVMIPAA